MCVICLYFYLLFFNLYLLLYVRGHVQKQRSLSNITNERTFHSNLYTSVFTIFGARLRYSYQIRSLIVLCHSPRRSSKLNEASSYPKSSICTKHSFHTRVHVSRSSPSTYRIQIFIKMRDYENASNLLVDVETTLR